MLTRTPEWEFGSRRGRDLGLCASRDCVGRPARDSLERMHCEWLTIDQTADRLGYDPVTVFALVVSAGCHTSTFVARY